MRHVMSASDYCKLFPGQSYPKRTAAAAAELVARGLKANVATLDYLVNKGVVQEPHGENGARRFLRPHGKLLDVAGAHDALPALPLDGPAAREQRATGTADVSPLAPLLAPRSAHEGHSEAPADPISQDDPIDRPETHTAISACKYSTRRPESSSDTDRLESGREALTVNHDRRRAWLAKTKHSEARCWRSRGGRAA